MAIGTPASGRSSPASIASASASARSAATCTNAFSSPLRRSIASSDASTSSRDGQLSVADERGLLGCGAARASLCRRPYRVELICAACRRPTGCPTGVVRVRADNPSPLTLDGTNTYVVDGLGRRSRARRRPATWTRWPRPRAAGGGHRPDPRPQRPLRGRARRSPERTRRGRSCGRGGGERVGPFEVIATPGHAPDHVCAARRPRAVHGRHGARHRQRLHPAAARARSSAYLDSLRRLRELDLEAILPGHGPVVWDPRAKLDEYIEHRLVRERRVLAALDAGARTHDELLDRAWSDVDFDAEPYLRFAAAATLEAHLEKLAEEGRLPAEVERAG